MMNKNTTNCEASELRSALIELLRFHREDDDGAELPREYWAPAYRAAVEKAETLIGGLSKDIYAIKEENEAMLDLLALMFDKYENGEACYENPEEYEGFIGYAVDIDDETFYRIVKILNERRPKTPSAEVTGLDEGVAGTIVEEAIEACARLCDKAGAAMAWSVAKDIRDMKRGK